MNNLLHNIRMTLSILLAITGIALACNESGNTSPTLNFVGVAMFAVGAFLGDCLDPISYKHVFGKKSRYTPRIKSRIQNEGKRL